MHLGGYSVAMLADVSETLFSTTTLLWLAVAATSAAILFGSMNRRRSQLTESLRDYVGKHPDFRKKTDSDEGSDNPIEQDNSDE